MQHEMLYLNGNTIMLQPLQLSGVGVASMVSSLSGAQVQLVSPSDFCFSSLTALNGSMSHDANLLQQFEQRQHQHQHHQGHSLRLPTTPLDENTIELDSVALPIDVDSFVSNLPNLKELLDAPLTAVPLSSSALSKTTPPMFSSSALTSTSQSQFKGFDAAGEQLVCHYGAHKTTGQPERLDLHHKTEALLNDDLHIIEFETESNNRYSIIRIDSANDRISNCGDQHNNNSSSSISSGNCNSKNNAIGNNRKRSDYVSSTMPAIGLGGGAISVVSLSPPTANNTIMSDMVCDGLDGSDNIAESGEAGSFLNLDQMSTVDILNQVILTASTSSAKYDEANDEPMEADDDLVSTIDMDAPFVHGNKKNNSCKIKRKDQKISCNVCYQISSGYHYGSDTCEACKLFFRRTEKQIRKTGFNECRLKNCQINNTNRANCSECRYKKCIAVGMCMSRSQYGRNTNRPHTTYTSNISESLCLLVEKIQRDLVAHKTATTAEGSAAASTADDDDGSAEESAFCRDLNERIVHFYQRSVELMSASKSRRRERRPAANSVLDEHAATQTQRDSNARSRLSPSAQLFSSEWAATLSASSSLLMTTSLSEISSVLSSCSSPSSPTVSERCNNNISNNSNNNNERSPDLPRATILMFCELFDISTRCFATKRWHGLKVELQDYIQLIQDHILRPNPFAKILKIGLFLRVLRFLFKALSERAHETEAAARSSAAGATSNADYEDDQYDKRLMDLMQAEMALYKFDSASDKWSDSAPARSSPVAASSSFSSSSSSSSSLTGLLGSKTASVANCNENGNRLAQVNCSIMFAKDLIDLTCNNMNREEFKAFFI